MNANPSQYIQAAAVAERDRIYACYDAIADNQRRARGIREEFVTRPPEEQARLLREAEDLAVDDRIAELQMERHFGKDDE